MTLRKLRQPPGRPPDAGAAVGGRGDRLARPGAADRRWHRAGGKYLDNLPYHVWVLMGDSEMAEGSSGRRSDWPGTTSWTT